MNEHSITHYLRLSRRQTIHVESPRLQSPTSTRACPILVWQRHLYDLFVGKDTSGCYCLRASATSV
jgi:hypothetical protein